MSLYSTVGCGKGLVWSTMNSGSAMLQAWSISDGAPLYWAHPRTAAVVLSTCAHFTGQSCQATPFSEHWAQSGDSCVLWTLVFLLYLNSFLLLQHDGLILEEKDFWYLPTIIISMLTPEWYTSQLYVCYNEKKKLLELLIWGLFKQVIKWIWV